MLLLHHFFIFFFFNDTATTEIYTLSLHDALPICGFAFLIGGSSTNGAIATSGRFTADGAGGITDVIADENNSGGIMLLPQGQRSEEHTSELQSPCNLVCRLLLEKKKKKKNTSTVIYTNFTLKIPVSLQFQILLRLTQATVASYIIELISS